MMASMSGLSPRVRGNPTRFRELLLPTRSIPARAGEPRSGSPDFWSQKVYPRACGGTFITSKNSNIPSGLSPRVRGNPFGDTCACSEFGSIPARAGEPRVSGRRTQVNGVYPRACGGTGFPSLLAASRQGLSPRVRGNPFLRKCAMANVGSIPARAGEPRSGADCFGRNPVYPRACGGTFAGELRASIIDGLSPRVRGNPPCSLPYLVYTRSIPARAGEPHRKRCQSPRTEVYPRACGGTHFLESVPWLTSGLSPRVRGNRQSGRLRAG